MSYIVQKLHNLTGLIECLKFKEKNKFFAQSYPHFLWI